MRPQIAGLGVWIGVMACAGAALAQSPVCADRDSVVARLASEYGETRQAIGLASADQVVEIFASDETGSWTITVTRTDGMTCLVAAGQNYQELDEALTPTALGDPA